MKYYNKKGKEISYEVCQELLGEFDYRLVEQTDLDNGKWVSTAWIGIPHNFGKEDEDPLIFESMVFPEPGSFDDIDRKLYATREKAIEGHHELVKKYKAIDV